MAEIKKEDYELQCSCGNRGSVPGGRINIVRVREKLDALEAAGDIPGAERLLEYWLAEARNVGDTVGEILVENEMIGMYRKAGRGEESLLHGDRALKLLREYGLEDHVMAATTRINMATACTAFGREKEAWDLFQEARALYEKQLSPTDGRLGGLYNNMGLSAMSLGRFQEGRELFALALQVTSRVPHAEGEAAMTCLNLADLVSAEAEAAGDEDSLIRAAEETEELVDRAWELLMTPDLPRDGYYRFICDKCAPVFDHYGRLEEAEKLRSFLAGQISL